MGRIKYQMGTLYWIQSGKTMVRGLLQCWDRVWFSSTDRYHYGLFRIILVGGLFLIAWDSWGFTDLNSVARASGQFTQPVLLAQTLHFSIPISPDLVTPMRWALRLLAVTSLIGVATRPSLILLSLYNLYLNSLRNSFGFIDHGTTLPSLVLLVIAFSPGVTQLSVDSLIAYIRKKGFTRPPTLNLFGGSFPVWPAKLILVVMALAYFTSGLSKVRFGGITWMDGQTLTTYLSEPQPDDYFAAQRNAPDSLKWKDGVGLESFIYGTGQSTPLGRFLAGIPAVMMFLSTVSVIWEITFPVVLIFRRLLPLYLLMGIAFHVSIMATLSLYSFYSYILCYALFVDWKRVTLPVVRRLQPLAAGSP